VLSNDSLEAHMQTHQHVGYFVNLSNFYKKGYSPDFDNPTHLNNLSLSIGPKFYFPLTCSPCMTPYLGIGLTGTWIHIHDQGENIIPYFDKGAFGPCFKSGFILNRSRFYIDVFFDYYIGYAKNYEQEYVNFSNLRSGVGLGYKF
jgi:hypothetical protein